MSEAKQEIFASVKTLADIRLRAFKLAEQLDTTSHFRQKLRERIAAGEYALRSALEDLQRSLP